MISKCDICKSRSYF